MLKGTVIIERQETDGNYKFAGVPHFMTRGFQNIFGDEATSVAFTALALIQEEYPDNADYLQSFKYLLENGRHVWFWCIHSEEYVTFLLPEEY